MIKLLGIYINGLLPFVLDKFDSGYRYEDLNESNDGATFHVS